MKTLGQIAYENYCGAVGGVAANGKTLQGFETLGVPQRKAWESCANLCYEFGHTARPIHVELADTGL